MGFDALLLPAEAIRELRARGVTTPGIAELLVRHHGAEHVLLNLHRIDELLSEIYLLDLEIAKELRELLERQPPAAQSAALKFLNAQGEIMPLTVHINDAPGKAILTEFASPNGTGQVVPPVGAVSYVSSNPAVATVDPASGALAYVSAGTATITGTDAGNGLTASDTLTVTAATAQSATLTLQPGAAAPSTTAAK